MITILTPITYEAQKNASNKTPLTAWWQNNAETKYE